VPTRVVACRAGATQLVEIHDVPVVEHTQVHHRRCRDLQVVQHRCRNFTQPDVGGIACAPAHRAPTRL
jgi:hypothetical protein